MKSLYKSFAFLFLAVACCCNLAFAGNDDPEPEVSISSPSTVCPGQAFTATAVVSNLSLSGLVYEWSVGIGTANGQLLLTTTSRSATIRVNRPFVGDRGNIVVRVLQNGDEKADDAKPVTLRANTTPSRPGTITISNNNPSTPGFVICQNSNATFSVPAVAGANAYRWTIGGNTTTAGRTFTTFLTTVGNSIPVSVVAVGCGGSSAASTSSIFVIPANQSPCNGNQFSRTASSPDKLSVSTYPNPVDNGSLKLDVSQDYLLSSAQLIDQKTGKVVKSFTITDQNSVLTTSDLPKGTYLLRLRNKEATLTRRIAIE